MKSVLFATTLLALSGTAFGDGIQDDPAIFAYCDFAVTPTTGSLEGSEVSYRFSRVSYYQPDVQDPVSVIIDVDGQGAAEGYLKYQREFYYTGITSTGSTVSMELDRASNTATVSHAEYTYTTSCQDF